jgi:hypothetical protein
VAVIWAHQHRAATISDPKNRVAKKNVLRQNIFMLELRRVETGSPYWAGRGQRITQISVEHLKQREYNRPRFRFQ